MKPLVLIISFISLKLTSFAQFEAKKDTFQYFNIIDTNVTLYSLPSSFSKTKTWKKKDQSNSKNEWYGNTFSDTLKLKDVLAIIDTSKFLWEISSTKSWCLKNYKQAFPHLIKRLGNKTKIGLTGTADLIIWDRIGTGDLKFYGHGGSIEEDIFTISGRASWILNEITGESFAKVHGSTSKEDIKLFKQKWIQYISNLKN
jgi:hypothetical protein